MWAALCMSRFFTRQRTVERAFWAKGASYVNAERLWHMEGKRRVSHSIQTVRV